MAAYPNADQGLDWKDYLDASHRDVPLHALKYSCRHRLALYLNKEQDVMHNGIMPDFGGLAELIGFDGLEIENFEKAENPGKKVLDEWTNRHELKPTVGRLMEFLSMMGRIDILTDCHKRIESEVLSYLDKPKQFALAGPVQDETEPQRQAYGETPEYITRQDVSGQRKVMYDAFVCYNPKGEASKDIEFVQDLIAKFEAPPLNLKLFVPYRDDLPGFNEHKINAQIISERCRHMIVVLSNNFHESEACDFQTSFAFSLSPGARDKRIVPIKIDNCPIPNVLRIMACCDFTKKDLWAWSWDRLSRSVMVQLSSSDYQLENSPTLDLSSSFLPPVTLTPSSWSTPPNAASKESENSSQNGFGREKRSPSDADLGYNSISSTSNGSPVSRRSNETPPEFSASKQTGQNSKVQESIGFDTASKPQNPTATSDILKAKSQSSPSFGSRALKKLADLTGRKSKNKEKTKVACTEC